MKVIVTWRLRRNCWELCAHCPHDLRFGQNDFNHLVANIYGLTTHLRMWMDQCPQIPWPLQDSEYLLVYWVLEAGWAIIVAGLRSRLKTTYLAYQGCLSLVEQTTGKGPGTTGQEGPCQSTPARTAWIPHSLWAKHMHTCHSHTAVLFVIPVSIYNQRYI